MTTTFTKLRNGSWGIKGDASRIVDGGLANVYKKDHTTKTVRVEKVIWTNGSIAIASIASDRSPHTTSRPTYRDTCRTGGDCWSFTSIRHCHECGK